MLLCILMTMSAIGVGGADEVQVPAAPAAAAQTVVLSTDPADYAQPVAEAAFGIQEREPVEHSYFDDAVFIGDSISLKLYYYVKAQRQTDKNFLGKAQFLVAGSLGSGNALWDVSAESVHPSYRGSKMRIEDAVAAMGVKKIYIMLGINDVTMYGIDGSVENMKTLIEGILKKSPEAEIFVQSATPRIAAMKSNPTNRMLFDYDLKLYQMCVEQGWHFVDVASVMRDEKGNLPEAYCSDAPTMGMHFTNEACQVWVDYLLTHTPAEEPEVIEEPEASEAPEATEEPEAAEDADEKSGNAAEESAEEPDEATEETDKE